MATIEFFAHPDHRLAEHDEDTDYLCSGCKTTGDGPRYRCTDPSCHFDLHKYCATCPMKLSSFMHPKHPLVFGLHNDRVPCDVCGESVDGLFYRCKDCNFNVHPVCTQLPEKVRHVAHLGHPLTLQKASPGACIACAEECPSWRYRCGLGGACMIDIHIECVLEQYLSPNVIPSKQAHPPPQTCDYGYQKPSPSQFLPQPQPPLYSGNIGYDKARALPEQPPSCHYYNNPPPHPYNNHRYQKHIPPHFPPQPPVPSGYAHDKANAPPPPYYGYHQPYYPPPQPLYYHHHPSAPPPTHHGYIGQTGYSYGVPSSSSGHNIVKPNKEGGPKKGKKGKIMCAIVGRLILAGITGVILGVPLGF